MSLRRSVAAVSLACLSSTAVLVPAAGASSASARHFANCTAMHKVYRHGVGRPGSHDHTSGKPVTTFKRSTALYNANKSSDRDKDGIACEQA